MRLLLVGLAAVIAGCTGGSGDRPADVRATAPVSRGANGDCVRAWNAAGNSANRSAAASDHDGWAVDISEWTVSHPAPDPSASALIGEGCSYFFRSPTHWRSYSGSWEADGDLRWDDRLAARGRRTPEQQIQPPNAVLQSGGELARLAADDGRPVSGRESRSVIDDWYDNGEFDRTHRCGAVREAIARLPRDIPYSSAVDDIRRYAGQVC